MNKHENRIQGMLEKEGLKARCTIASGAKCDDADIRLETSNSKYMIEAKERPQNNNIAIPYKFIKKVKNQALRRGVDWLVIYTNAAGEDYVVMDFNQFLYETRSRNERNTDRK